MMMGWLRRHRMTAFDRFADAIRVLVALSGVILYAAPEQHNPELMPLTLGVIAAGMAETHETWPGRARTLAITLICFGVMAGATGVLVGIPWLFAPFLWFGVFALAMFRAAGGHFATVGNAALVLAIYAMISASPHLQTASVFWSELLCLMLGAAWYGLVALVWNAALPHRPVRHSLARLYAALADLLIGRSRQLEPGVDPQAAARCVETARLNARVVEALADSRRLLVGRRFPRRSRSVGDDYWRLYRAAEAIHERASAEICARTECAPEVPGSDLLCRCQRVLRAAGTACRERAAAVRHAEAWNDDGRMSAALADLDTALAQRRSAAAGPEPAETPRALRGIADNLRDLVECLRHSGGDGRPDTDGDARLAGSRLAPAAVYRAIRAEFTPGSVWFRHALRLSLAILAGYAIVLALHPTQGYWILLTTLLVCQPDYANTRQRIVQRFGGTLAGLLIAGLGMRLFPEPGLQLAGIVIAAVVFFVARFRWYATATAGISVFALVSFNQIGNGFDLIGPRLIDTLIGGALAVLAMLLVMPDWRERELRGRLARALAADARYLRALARQYRAGRSDDRDYRDARRDAQAATAAVGSHVLMARSDPYGQRADSREALAVLACTRKLLGHLSMLGAHRRQLTAADAAAMNADAACIAGALEHSARLLTASTPESFDIEPAPDRRDEPQGARLSGPVAVQLGLLLDELTEVQRIGRRLLAPRPE